MNANINCDADSDKFILVKKLFAGDYFGLADLLFDAQPSMQLISNGCECILLPKDVFIQNSNIDHLKELRKSEPPYPKLDQMQNDYKSQAKWKKFRKSLIRDKLRKEIKIAYNKLKI